MINVLAGMVITGSLEYRNGVTNLVVHRLASWPAPEMRFRDFR